MAILTMPAFKRYADYSFDPVFNTKMHRSPFDGSVQTLGFPGALWLLRVTFPTFREETGGEEWRAFFSDLGGAAGRFYAGDGRRIVPRGTAGVAPGAPVIDGAGQMGAVINIRGATMSVPTYFLIGDMVSFDLPSGERSLHRVQMTTATDVGGLAALIVKPPLRESPADGEALQLTPATCIMHLIDDRQGIVPIRRDGVYQVSFEAEEIYDGILGS